MSAGESTNISEMYPMLKRLIRERHQTGRCSTWDVWTREAVGGIDQLWPNPGPRARQHRQQILAAYQITGKLVEQLIVGSVARKPGKKV